MSRVIKFRAWDGNRMRDDFLLDAANKSLPCKDNYKTCESQCAVVEFEDFIEELDNLEIMQFTGLLDKNGVEIYESDLVKISPWRQGCQQATEKNKKVLTVYWGARGHWTTDDSTFALGIYSNIEVIGNIHQNPELL